MHRVSGNCVLAVGVLITFSGCGGGTSTAPGNPNPNPNPNPVPVIQAISPNSSEPAGPDFTLSVVGSNFIPESAVQWNGTKLQSTFLNSALLTAQVPASALLASGTDSVSVVSPGPGGGTSNSLDFAVPCVVDPPAPASLQTKARVGAYYFDGWSGPLTNFHFAGLPLGPYQDREPLSAWQDNSQCAVEQQLAQATMSASTFSYSTGISTLRSPTRVRISIQPSRSRTPYLTATVCNTPSFT